MMPTKEYQLQRRGTYKAVLTPPLQSADTLVHFVYDQATNNLFSPRSTSGGSERKQANQVLGVSGPEIGL